MTKAETLLAIVFKIAFAEDKGYHSLVGIPEAKRIYEDEIKPDAPRAKVYNALFDHHYLVGVVIKLNETFSVCGASLITNDRAITAAHCWWDGFQQARELALVFASEYLFRGGTRIRTKNVVMHDQWDPKALVNDLAMIGFHYFEYTYNVQPIELPSSLQDTNYIDTVVVASGYGKSMPDSAGFAPLLKQMDVSMVVVPTSECINSTRYLMERTLCTRSHDKFCIRYSGGPLVLLKENERFLVGVASFGDYSCTHNQDILAGFCSHYWLFGEGKHREAYVNQSTRTGPVWWIWSHHPSWYVLQWTKKSAKCELDSRTKSSLRWWSPLSSISLAVK